MTAVSSTTPMIAEVPRTPNAGYSQLMSGCARSEIGYFDRGEFHRSPQKEERDQTADLLEGVRRAVTYRRERVWQSEWITRDLIA
jgi:hypothetical protein